MAPFAKRLAVLMIICVRPMAFAKDSMRGEKALSSRMMASSSHSGSWLALAFLATSAGKARG